MPETLAALPSARLLARMRELVQRGNAVEAELLAHLGEVDARRLYLEEGCSSMFAYCQRVLHFAEGLATSGSRPLARRGEIQKFWKPCATVRATARSSFEPLVTRAPREIRQLVADRNPRPAQPTTVCPIAEPAKPKGLPATLPQASPPAATRATSEQPAPELPARPTLPAKGLTEPLGAERYRVQFTADREMHAQLEELRALMRHQIPDGDVGKILARAVRVLLAQVRKRKFAETSRPRPASSSPPHRAPSQHIPESIRRAVSQRDAGRCSYVSPGGRRCGAKEFLEFDHAEAWTWTHAHSIGGITLRCRAHNQQRARLDFGEVHLARFGRTGFKSSSEPGRWRSLHLE
jgi:hypothetical protein